MSVTLYVPVAPATVATSFAYARAVAAAGRAMDVLTFVPLAGTVSVVATPSEPYTCVKDPVSVVLPHT